jgi:hypothetical protein
MMHGTEWQSMATWVTAATEMTQCTPTSRHMLGICKSLPTLDCSLQALKGLKSRLGDMLQYLEAVVSGKLPVNNEIIGLMQDMFNLLPNLNIETLSQSLTGAPFITTHEK